MISYLLHRVKNIDKKKATCNFYIFSSTSFSLGTSYYFLSNTMYNDTNDYTIFYRNINI